MFFLTGYRPAGNLLRFFNQILKSAGFPYYNNPSLNIRTVLLFHYS